MSTPRLSSLTASSASLVSGDVRTHNLSLVLEHLVANGPSARSEIAVSTGLSRGAVTALVGALTEHGILRDQPVVASARRGRPLTRLGFAADSVAMVTAQVDADRSIAVVSNLAGEPLERFELKHGRPMGRPEVVLDVLAQVLERALSAAADGGRRVADLTVIAFAPVGGDPAVVLADTDLGWGRVDVIGGLRSRLDCMPENARLVADTTVAALAEQRGYPRTRDLLYLKSNSGIGGAIISNSLLVTGAHAIAGALGHLAVDFNGAPCLCGQRGCLVTVAGPDVVLERAGLGGELRREGLTWTLARLVRLVHDGDAAASAAWSEAVVWIARTLRILTLAIDPAVIVLGGYWAYLSDTIAAEFYRGQPSLFPDAGRSLIRVVPGSLGEDAALLGALWSARDRLLTDPLALAG